MLDSMELLARWKMEKRGNFLTTFWDILKGGVKLAPGPTAGKVVPFMTPSEARAVFGTTLAAGSLSGYGLSKLFGGSASPDQKLLDKVKELEASDTLKNWLGISGLGIGGIYLLNKYLEDKEKEAKNA